MITPPKVVAPPNVVPTPPVAAAPHPVAASRPVAPSPTSLSLKDPAAEVKWSSLLGYSTDPKSLTVSIMTNKGGAMEVKVTFSGMWDGKYIRGAIRAIEHQYKQIKHNVTREAAAARAKLSVTEK